MTPRHSAPVLVLLLATCSGETDMTKDDVRTWANSGSALGVYTSIEVVVAAAAGEIDFSGADCPVVEDDGTVLTIEGDCGDANGNEWAGLARVVRSDPDTDIELDDFVDGAAPDMVAPLTGTAKVRRMSGLHHAFEVDLVRTGGTTTTTRYVGEVEGWFDQPTTWNGSGTVEREGGLLGPHGSVAVATDDQVWDAELCSGAAASGRTTIESESHEVVVTYDGATDCDEDEAAQWSMDGKDRGEITGITCAVVPGGPGGAGLAALCLPILRRRRRHPA